MLAVGGISLNIISKNNSLRLGGFVGAAVMIVGSFSTIFITNTNQLPVTFGMLQGIGFGMMVPVIYATINHNFVKKRTTVMSICKALQGMILMWYPQMLEKIQSYYGFRGTLLILSGISLHTIPGIMTMKICNETRRKTRTASGAEHGVREQENIDLLTLKDNKEDSKMVENKLPQNIRLVLLEILNLKVLKDAVYCNICLGQSFVNFSDLTFFIFQPMLLFQYGFDNTQVAACISMCSGADVAGRFALAVISSALNVNTRLLFFVSTLFTFIIRIVILQVRQFILVFILIGALGILRAWLHVASPLNISNYVSHSDFPGAYALFMLSTGIVNVTCGPVVGLLKDIYQDYVPTYYALTLCCLPCLILWPIEHVFTKKLRHQIGT